MGLFTDHTYPAQAVSLMESVEISWPESVLLRLIHDHPQIAINLIKLSAIRLRELQERLRELATQRVERRIARALLRLAKQAGQRTKSGTAINFPVGRKDIAEMCGATLHTVSRTLKTWEREDVLSTKKRLITLKSLSELRRRSEE